MNRIMSMLLSILSALVVFLPFGNPLSDFLVTKNSEIYVETTYADTDYIIDETTFDFKTGSYYVQVVSPSSPDSSFTIYADLKGNISYDTYESAVVKKWNTAGRIDDAYRAEVDKMLGKAKLPCEIDFGFGEIVFKESDTPIGDETPFYAISTEELVLDGEYDSTEMGKRAGKLTVYFYDKNVTSEKMAEILLALKDSADAAGVGFKAADCVLQLKQGDKEVRVSEFMYDDIYEQGLVDRVNENIRSNASSGEKEQPV